MKSDAFIGLDVGLEANKRFPRPTLPLTDTQIQTLRARGARCETFGSPRASALGDADRREALEPGLSFRRRAAVARHRSLPTTTLKEARARRDEAKRQLKAGLDPSHQKRLAKLAVAADQANTFEALAAEYLERENHRSMMPQERDQNDDWNGNPDHATKRIFHLGLTAP